MALLADTLYEHGHDVTWWCSTYDHEAKRQRFDRDTEVAVNDRYRIHLLHARAYRRNVSLQRLQNHREVASQFATKARQLEKPDLIVATVPIVELARAAAEYASELGVPFVVDVRDQHPDIYLGLLPGPARPLGRLLLWPLFRDVRHALKSADAITATSNFFLNWALGHAKRKPRSTDAVFPLAYPQLPSDENGSDDLQRRFEEMDIRPGQRIIWYVGTFNRWIDLGTPIEAARRLAERGVTEPVFVFSGHGDFAERWRQQAAGLPNVRFTGWIRSREIAYLREIAWCGLAPYRVGFTTMGNKLFEFMSGSLPILSSLDGEPKALLESLDVGLSYESGNAESLAKEVERLLHDPELHARLSRNSGAAYQSRFRADIVYPGMVEFLEARAEPRRPVANPAGR